ncbi:hypothetical protein RDWZM_008162, partial [Blomia tropicalis]
KGQKDREKERDYTLRQIKTQQQWNRLLIAWLIANRSLVYHYPLITIDTVIRRSFNRSIVLFGSQIGVRQKKDSPFHCRSTLHSINSRLPIGLNRLYIVDTSLKWFRCSSLQVNSITNRKCKSPNDRSRFDH